jgi:hypothetical protein
MTRGISLLKRGSPRPITTTPPSSRYWGLNQSIRYGDSDSAPILENSAGLIDAGTTLILLAKGTFLRDCDYLPYMHIG